MKFCQPHWESLREAIRERGLYRFVAKSGPEVMGKMVADHGEAENFEPLMGAHNAILSQIMRIGGIDVMMDNPDGTERCPICYANAKHKEFCTDPVCTYSYDHFIERAADDALAEATRRGLVGTA
jgi:hypothetical protein